MKAVILFTMQGCGPCNALLGQGIVSELTRECNANKFSFAHYELHGRMYMPRDPPQGIKQTNSFPELCFVTYNDYGHVTGVKSFSGGNDISNFSCWLRHRRQDESWTSGWLCPDNF